VQIGPGIATLNFTASYRWERFQAAAEQFIEHLKRAYESAVSLRPHLQQVTLRYINAVPFQFEEQDIYDFLRSKLHITLELPRAIVEMSTQGLAASLNLTVNYPLGKPRGMGVLNIGRGQTSGAQALVWDLILASTGSDVPSLDELAPWLSDAHDVLGRWFLTLVEGELLDNFKGEDSMVTVPDVSTSQTATTIAGRKRDLGILGGASMQVWPDELSGGPRSDATIETRLSGIEEQPKVYGSQLLDLGDPRYLLSCPLLVVLEAYSDEVVASIPEFDLYASGVSDSVALAKLKVEVVSTYERLVELEPERLGPLPRGWLAAMNRVIGTVHA
jgi:hypothetical protein